MWSWVGLSPWGGECLLSTQSGHSEDWARLGSRLSVLVWAVSRRSVVCEHYQDGTGSRAFAANSHSQSAVITGVR